MKKFLIPMVAVAVVLANAGYANDRKPAKDNPTTSSPGSSSSNSANSETKSSNSPSQKIQEPVPAPTPTSQPVEVETKLNSAERKSDTPSTTSTVTSTESSQPKPEPAKSEQPKPEPAKSEQPKPEPAKSEQPKPEPSEQSTKSVSESVSSTSASKGNAPEKRSLNTAAISRSAVVNPSSFKNQRLVAGKFAPGLVNAAAKEIESEEADQLCGAPENKKENSKAVVGNSKSSSSASTKNSSSGKAKGLKGATTITSSNSSSRAVEAKQKASEPVEECKDYILVFSEDTSSSDIEDAASEAKGKVLKKFSNVFKGAVVNGPPSKIIALSKNPKVQSIELDGSVSTQEIYSNVVWGLDRSDQRLLPLDSIFDDLDNGGFSIPVYVVDTGIYAEHSEFVSRVAAGATTITDGYGTWDCNGHGTHVAGTIAGAKYGIAKSATLIPVRVLDCSGSGTYSGVIAGLDWIAANHPSGVPAVVNMSLGGPASSSLDSAVNNLISRGITVVVAAGNSGADACNYSPSRVPAAITVAATSIDDARASYSNFGSCIDIFAPGSGITSAWINGTSGSAVASGTSMAAPHVAGAIARFLYINPTSSPFQVANSVTKSATLDLLQNIGSGTPNRLLYLDIALDSATEPVTSTRPTKSKKTTNPGKGNKP